MTLILRRALLALALIAGFSPAIAAPPPPVPSVQDVERRTQYTIAGTTCACAVNFPVFGDSTDYSNWVEVWLNGTRVNYNDPTFGWALTSPTGPVGLIARPIVDAVITFNSPQTGTVQIVGARKPRRISQFNSRSATPRDLDVAFSDLVTMMRETWDRTNDVTGRSLLAPPGDTLGTMPPAATRAGKFLYFDGTGRIPQFTTGGAGTGNVVGPPTSTNGSCVVWANSTGTLLGETACNEQSFATLALAAAATIPPSVTVVKTSGRLTPNDNGGTEYSRIAPSTPALWRFQSVDGQWWANNSRTLTPEMFGCFAGGGGDCTPAFVAISTILNTFAGGYTVNFSPNAEYLVWPAGTSPAANVMNLVNVNGTTFNFNGGRIYTDNAFSAPIGRAIFSIANSSNLIFNDPSFICTSCSGAIDPLRYGVFFYVNEIAAPWSNNIKITNAKDVWHSSFLIVVGDQTGAVQDQAHGITVLNADLQHVFYGMAFEQSGDGVLARGIKCTDCGRDYFPSNVRNHDVEIIKNGGGGGYVSSILKAYALPKASDIKRGLSNIHLKYSDSSENTANAVMLGLDVQQTVAQPNVSGAVNNGAGLVRLTVDTTANMATGQKWFVNSVGGITGTTNGTEWPVTVVNGTQLDLQGSVFGGTYTSGGYMRVPASWRDITIQVESTLASSQPVQIATYKENLDGTPDTTTDGYTVENVTISGSIRNLNYGVPALSLFADNSYSHGSWVGENIRNFNLTNLTLEGTNSSAIIDATGVQANLNLTNVWSTPTTIPWTITGAGTNYRPMNVSGTGLTDRQAVVPSSAGANQFATGLTSATGALSYAQPSFSNLSGQATLAQFPTMATNTALVNATSGSAVPTAFAMSSCSTSSSALIWTTNTGFGCNTAITASTATTATNATNTTITDDTTTNATVYPTWVTATTGNLPQKVSSTKVTLNPSTGVLSSTSFTGAGTGLTGTAAGLTAGNVTTNANLTGAITSVGNAASLGSFTSAQLAAALTNETGSGSAVFATDPTFPSGITVTNGINAGTVNNVAIATLGSTGGYLTASGKNLTVNKTLTLDGTDSTTMTFPATSATIARTDAGQTFTGGANTFSSTITGSISGNAATVTTNANLTGDVTSVGNASTLAAGSASNLNSGTLLAARMPAHTGDVTSSAGSIALTLAAGNAGNLNSGTLLAARMPALTGDCTTSAGAVATTCTKINGVDQTTAWSTYTPTVTAGSGSPAVAGTATGRYKQIGKTAFYQITVTNSSNVSGASGTVKATLPLTAATNGYTGTTFESSITGKSGASFITTGAPTIVQTAQADGTTWWVNSYVINIGGTYELP